VSPLWSGAVAEHGSGSPHDCLESAAGGPEYRSKATLKKKYLTNFSRKWSKTLESSCLKSHTLQPVFFGSLWSLFDHSWITSKDPLDMGYSSLTPEAFFWGYTDRRAFTRTRSTLKCMHDHIRHELTIIVKPHDVNKRCLMFTNIGPSRLLIGFISAISEMEHMSPPNRALFFQGFA
jgi:hypothetical protein